MYQKIKEAAKIIRNAKHVTAFTGAGISVESGIPPFRGENGLWSKYDPKVLELSYFHSNPKDAWKIIRELFYDFFGKASPNEAHYFLAKLENAGMLKAVITQNIDNLHQEAGSKTVYEFHGTAQYMVCTSCDFRGHSSEVNLKKIPVKCPKCKALIKPDFIFFGEGIPELALEKSSLEAEIADVFIVIGTTGEVMPACMIPPAAARNGAKIIEINPEASSYTNRITDIFLRGKATEVAKELTKELKL